MTNYYLAQQTVVVNNMQTAAFITSGKLSTERAEVLSDKQMFSRWGL